MKKKISKHFLSRGINQELRKSKYWPFGTLEKNENFSKHFLSCVRINQELRKIKILVFLDFSEKKNFS